MKLRFEKKLHEVGDIYTFIFVALEPTEWQAGQSIRIELPAGWGTEERRFTISAAPYERHLTITTRVSGSDFKQALAALKPGMEVDAYDIRGNFVWQDGQVVLAASGVGITPYMAMLRQRQHLGSPLAAAVIYAFDVTRPLFVNELRQLSELYPEFVFVPVTGRHLDAADVLPYAQGKDVYLAGPSAMIRSLAVSLLEQGITESRLKNDWFTGRAGWEA